MGFEQGGSSGGGGTSNLKKKVFNTVNGQKIYTAAEVGVNLTGKTLYEVVLGQTIVAVSKRAINGSGGITFTDNIVQVLPVTVNYE